MSGLEILGIAASVVQIADLGARLSVQLIGFSRKVKEANKSLEAISQEIAVTGAVLQELGAELKKDDNKSGCSRRALETAQQLVKTCKDIFKEIDEVIKPNGSTAAVSWKQRLKYPFFESKLALLRTKLESLKSSLLVILNVLVYAEQIRNREALPILKEQQALLERLVEEKRDNETKLQHALGGAQPPPNPPPAEEVKPPPKPPTVAGKQQVLRSPKPASFHDPFIVLHAQEAAEDKPQLSFLASEVEKELLGHCLFVEKIIREAELPQYSLSTRLTSKVQESALAGHWGEWSYLSRTHGHGKLLERLSKNKSVHSYWARRNAYERVAEPRSQIAKETSVTEHYHEHIKQSDDIPAVSANRPRFTMGFQAPENDTPEDNYNIYPPKDGEKPPGTAKQEENLYEILGLPNSASNTDIDKSFRRLALKYHPERNPGREDEVSPRFTAIQVARNTLKDPRTRKKYDKGLVKKMSLGTFLQDENYGSWAGEVEDMPLPRTGEAHYPRTNGYRQSHRSHHPASEHRRANENPPRLIDANAKWRESRDRNRLPPPPRPSHIEERHSAPGTESYPKGVERSQSCNATFQEPSMTPLTERSEWSIRNSAVSLQVPWVIPDSTPSNLVITKSEARQESPTSGPAILTEPVGPLPDTPPQNNIALNHRAPPTDPRSQWELEAETARLKRHSEEEKRVLRRRYEDEERKIKRLLVSEQQKSQRARQTQIDAETERLKILYRQEDASMRLTSKKPERYYTISSTGDSIEATVREEPTRAPPVPEMGETDQSPKPKFTGFTIPDQHFNLDFSTLENTEILEDFDFDSFILDDAFDFDFDGNLERSPVTSEIHDLLEQFGGFGNEELRSLLGETVVEETDKAETAQQES